MRSLTRLLRVSVPLVFLGLVPAALVHADPETLAKARAYIGADSALDGVKALKFVGQLEIVGADTPDGGTAQLEILFQKPDRQRITATNGTKTEITALDGYDAWQRVSDSTDAAKWQVTLLGPDQIKRLRANTFENLAFYKDLGRQGGRIEDRGAATVDGVACRKLAFIHGPGIVFTRSFEVATGRLVLTETESGTAIREEGEIKAGGLRFPARIITTNPSPDGGSRTIRVTFSSVEVNPTLDAALFAIPPLTN
jgi:hypothetical protein